MSTPPCLFASRYLIKPRDNFTFPPSIIVPYVSSQQPEMQGRHHLVGVGDWQVSWQHMAASSSVA
jgi:hypothetical protein